MIGALFCTLIYVLVGIISLYLWMLYDKKYDDDFGIFDDDFEILISGIIIIIFAIFSLPLILFRFFVKFVYDLITNSLNNKGGEKINDL